MYHLRHLNRFLWKQKFKYEDLHIAMLLLEKGDFMFSFNLQSGYHHVDVTEAHQEFLSFSWGCNYYVFLLVYLQHVTYSQNCFAHSCGTGVDKV